MAIWLAVTLIGNTLVDLVLFFATILVLKDTKTPIKGPPGVELTAKRFFHRTVSLDHIKQVKSHIHISL
ncbi:putative transferase [Rosa chinensis]|uniref:Putative transferase n=1 Tax=Rosa chinensis TaxID=74649 RepID=A0A2P6SP04_ROSCH|nr:putative transferase [Rosa chinensis]